MPTGGVGGNMTSFVVCELCLNVGHIAWNLVCTEESDQISTCNSFIMLKMVSHSQPSLLILQIKYL